jgi:transcriptional regulator with XRE-family HTH domain
MNQQDILRQAMLRSGQTRAQLSAELGVSVRTLDKWLLPETSGDFRRMPETALRLLSASYGVRKSDGLSMPYDWSNPGMPDDTLVISVLRRANFPDLVRVCADFGIAIVRSRVETTLNLVPAAERNILGHILERMLHSIEIALSEKYAA